MHNIDEALRSLAAKQVLEASSAARFNRIRAHADALVSKQSVSRRRILGILVAISVFCVLSISSVAMLIQTPDQLVVEYEFIAEGDATGIVEGLWANNPDITDAGISALGNGNSKVDILFSTATESIIGNFEAEVAQVPHLLLQSKETSADIRRASVYSLAMNAVFGVTLDSNEIEIDVTNLSQEEIESIVESKLKSLGYTVTVGVRIVDDTKVYINISGLENEAIGTIIVNDSGIRGQSRFYTVSFD